MRSKSRQIVRASRHRRWHGLPVLSLASALHLLLAGASLGAEEQASPAPIQPNVFAGRVVDHQGQPVVGATVAVAINEGGFIHYANPFHVTTHGPNEKVLFFFTAVNGRAEGKTQTGDEGSFRIENLKKGTYSLLAVHNDRGISVLNEVRQPNADAPIEV